ncbi:SGNH/GDSL hydrolase family protein [Eubacteriales bacterium OttesenSCG-928-A19]|nr:SGNH/GDSL hydrolase family protein [Eubacteriales bacterium OttesenSCG-928-A19]
MLYEKMHLWGDSLGKGVVFDEARKRYCITPERCVVRLQDALEMQIVNHSRMGAIAGEGLEGFLASPAEPGTLVVIEYGGNDCDMPWAEVAENPEGDYRGRVPLPLFRQHLRDFVSAVRERDMSPLLVTPPPLEATRYFAWVSQGLSQEAILRFLGDVQHIYRWQEQYSIAVREVAQEMHCPLFDMRSAFLADRRYPELFCADGIHPNAKGHALIAEAVIANVQELRGQLMAASA